MKSTNIQVDRLKQMLTLEQRRLDLQTELDSLVQQVEVLKKGLFDGGSSPVKDRVASSGPVRTRKAKRGQRGLLKQKITAALESAGALGVKVKDLAAALDTKPVNIHSWFHSALKRDKSITKITGGHYRLSTSGATAKGAAAAAPVKAKPAKVARKAGKGAKRGQLTADILGALKAAGSKGITVADLASKLGANYKNIYIWFATTGKKHPVKKLAPATYSLA
jgi:hypothetical protein